MFTDFLASYRVVIPASRHQAVGKESGLTAHIVIRGDQRKDVLYVPRQALFLKDSKRVVYVRNGNGFDPREVKIGAENESRAAIEGIGAGTDIALVDPTAPRKSANSGASSPGAGGGAP